MNKIKKTAQKILPDLDPLIKGNLNYKMIISVRTLHAVVLKGTILFGMVLYLKAQGMSMSNIAIVNTIYFFPQLFFKSFTGSLSDAVNNRRFFLYSAFFTSGIIYFFYPFVNSIYLFLLFRFVQGILESAIMPITQTVVAENSSDKDRGGKVGLYKIIVFGGTMVGPVFIGYLIETTGFMLMFYFSGFIMFTAALLSWFYIGSQELAHPRQEFKNILDQVSFSYFKKHFLDSFIFFTTKNDTPCAFSYTKLKNDPASLFLLVTFIRRTAFNFFIPFLPIYLTTIINLGEGTAGMYEGIRRLMIVLAIILSGRLADSWGRKPLLIIASFSFLGPVFYFFFPSLGGVWAGAIILGITVGCFNPTAITYMADFAPPQKEGTYLGAIGGVSSLSRLSPVVGGILAEIIGLPLTYLISGIILATTVPLSFLLKESLKK